MDLASFDPPVPPPPSPSVELRRSSLTAPTPPHPHNGGPRREKRSLSPSLSDRSFPLVFFNVLAGPRRRAGRPRHVGLMFPLGGKDERGPRKLIAAGRGGGALRHTGQWPAGAPKGRSFLPLMAVGVSGRYGEIWGWAPSPLFSPTAPRASERATPRPSLLGSFLASAANIRQAVDAPPRLTARASPPPPPPLPSPFGQISH